MNISSLFNAMPGAVAQGLIWGIMAIGVYITYKIQDVADLTVDGTMSLGGAICVLMLTNGQNIWVSVILATLAGMIAGLVTGILHTGMGIPVILSGILTQLGLYSINLKILGGKSNQAVPSLCEGRSILPELYFHCRPVCHCYYCHIILVLRNGTRLFHPCDRLQPKHEPCAGN